MKIQIIVDMNIVILGDGSVNIDCSKFKEQFIFCEINEKEKWIEKEPFNGKEQPEVWIEIEEFIDIAKLKSNQPNSYSVWDEDTKSWIEDIELKEQQRVQAIKSKAEELILTRYSITWQLNHPRTDTQYKSNYDFIDNIRKISNEAEANGTKVEDINWEITMANGNKKEEV